MSDLLLATLQQLPSTQRLKPEVQELLLWLKGLRTDKSVHEDADLITGLAQ